ncbi:hypothetical protein PHYSODRAFT_482983 [Phytophthora sojae]|uniref:PH domain-containing protein n=1 Tax=Phytophthora sojae (strain P6497) TaxID=1094619 RepID=G4YS85_PHYSP|nr:hypothetical protein PHYSODRAFT_482983 [Phytophthora sojae]EGZ24786.1 hypothetical protein PHYSODRAFT_482983 [Phytophthora sojae]|eukprot:XP_009520074.1 hypothetical protein PHYSODRAFT_482983 [Phytophthora sojae]
MQAPSPSSHCAHRDRTARGSSSNRANNSRKSGIGGILQPINPRAHASITTIPNNEVSLYMDDFTLDTPTFVTLASEMKMRICEVFWRRVHVQLICSREPSPDQFRQYSAVLCVRRRRRHGCIGSSSTAISLDRRMHPVRVLSTKAKDARKLLIGIEYGWRSRRVWFRAPNSAVYEQWNDVIRAALQGCNGGGCDEEESLAKWVERSGISMMETATTSAVCSMDRFSSDSYARGCSSSYRSDIPDDEWFESEVARRELRERTDTPNWMGRPAFCFTGPDNMRYEGQAA